MMIKVVMIILQLFYSIVTHVLYVEHQRLANTPRNLPRLRGGGTVYSGGLKEAKKAIAADRTTSSIIMIFMSDGGNNWWW